MNREANQHTGTETQATGCRAKTINLHYLNSNAIQVIVEPRRCVLAQNLTPLAVARAVLVHEDDALGQLGAVIVSRAVYLTSTV